MAQVQYVGPLGEPNVTRTLQAPKKMYELAHWYKAARKRIPQIPEVEGATYHQRSGFALVNTTYDLKWITFELEDLVGNRAKIVINRQASALV
jgi:hypothetical protein